MKVLSFEERGGAGVCLNGIEAAEESYLWMAGLGARLRCEQRSTWPLFLLANSDSAWILDCLEGQPFGNARSYERLDYSRTVANRVALQFSVDGGLNLESFTSNLIHPHKFVNEPYRPEGFRLYTPAPDSCYASSFIYPFVYTNFRFEPSHSPKIFVFQRIYCIIIIIHG